jgi:ribonuclease HI
VRQIEGRYKVKHEGLRPLYREASALLGRFTRWSVTHVRREQNKEADKLANRALDEKASGRI